MKKYFKYAYVSAIALLGASGFTACSSEDALVDVEEPQAQVVEDSPLYDPATGLVRSQFVLNIASQAQTRSSATTVQAGGENFRGIDNTLLFAYKTSGKGFIDATSAAAAAASRFDLGTVAAAGTLNNSDKSHRILELAMPTGTDALLFYGKAIKGSATPDYNEIGKVTYSVAGSTATAFQFDLTPRIGGNGARFTATAELLAGIMTKIVNVSGSSPDDYAECAARIDALEGIPAIELNISCPNVKQGGMAFGVTCEGAASVVRAVRARYHKTLIVKLSPNVTSVSEIARAVEAEGADSVSLINTLMGMAIDIERRKPLLSINTGGLSGPAVKPVALRMVWQVAKAVKIPVVGLGGICTATDAIEFLMAGATAIEIGTANFIDPAVTIKVRDGINDWLDSHGCHSVQEIIGTLDA